MRIAILRFDAPLMSFGGVVVDQHNPTDRFPYRAMLTGLIANALGWSRLDDRAHEALQARVRHGARIDRQGEPFVDYQTVDFDPGGPMGDARSWTTRGVLEPRKGGSAADGTHIRYRHYLADAVVTVALTLDPIDASPSFDDLAEALKRPARPLFIGRKCCVPSAPVWVEEREEESLRRALEVAPRVHHRPTTDEPLPALWPAGKELEALAVPRVEDRDFRNSIHVGRRFYVEGTVDPPRVAHQVEAP